MGNLNTHAIISVVDDHDVPRGALDRALLVANPSNFRVAHTFVFDDHGALLLQRTAPGTRSPGKWGSSSAGYVHAGESYREACQRTVARELGINIQPSLIGKTSTADLGATKFIELFQGCSNGPFRLDQSEAEEVKYLAIAEIKTALRKTPDSFTDTFRIVFDLYVRNRVS